MTVNSNVRVFAVVALMVLAAGFAFGTGQGEAGAQDGGDGEVVELRVMALANEAQREIYTGILERFNEQQDSIQATFEHITGGWDGFNQKLSTQLAAGTPPDVADISVIYRDSFINKGYLADVMPYAEANNFDFSQYYESNFEGLMRDGKLYGIPSGSSLIAMYYNKDLFDEAGLSYPSTDWADAWTWDEFRDVAIELTSGSGANRTYGFATTYDIGWFFPLFYQNNADFVNADGTESTVDEPNAVETLQYINDLMFVQETSPSMSALNTMDSYQLFMTGRVGVYMDGNWWMPAFSEIEDFRWGVAPLMREEQARTGVYVDSWSVISGSDHPEESWELLEFFMNRESQVAGINKGIPSMKTVAEEHLGEIYGYVSEEDRQVWQEGIRFGRTPTYTDNWAEVVAESNKQLQRMAIGDLTPAETAQAMQEAVDRILSR